MNTNHQIQSNSNTSTTNGQDRFVELDQGSAFPIAGRTYKNYRFIPITESIWDDKTAKEYREIVKELIDIFANNKVVSIEVSWHKTRMEKRDFFDRWTPPMFVENGRMQELRQEMKSGKWGKQLWADFLWYDQRKSRSLFLNLERDSRDYFRDIMVIQEKIDQHLLERMWFCCWETGGIGVTIFPHSKINYKENDKETIKNYHKTDDFIVYIANDYTADITVELNHKYISYNQMLEIIEPLFEKRGIKIKDKTDPYIYANYPPDYVEHNKYSYTGYQFF